MRKRKKQRVKGSFLAVPIKLLWDSRFHDLKASSRCLYFELLALACKRHSCPPRDNLSGSCTYKGLKMHTGFAPGTIARGLEALEEAGLLERPAKEDRRCLRVGALDVSTEYTVHASFKT